MRGFWGLMRAYWVSERWREAWALTAVIIGITALASKTSVWMAEASAELVNGIAFFHHPDNATPLQTVLTSAGLLMLLVLFKDLGLIGTRHLFSTTLHRKWRGWLDERFNQALLDRNHTHFHIQHATRAADGTPVPTPDNIEQRLQESIKGMTGGAIGLAMGVIGVFTSLWFVGEKLIETSGPVSGLDFLGSYGSAVLALTAVVLYVPLNTYIAVKVGRALQRLTNTMQQAEGSYRGELTTFLRRSFHVAATRGEAVQKATHDRLYSDIDRTWSRLNWFNAGYMSFELIYNFMAARIVSYAPGLVPYMNEKISLKGYITGAELVNSLISQCSWFIHVMPEIATLRTNARRVTELAEAIERVQRPDDFYRQTGRSDFRFGTQHSVFGLTVKDLELVHTGEDAQPFLSVPHLRFRRGEWTFVKGESGSGKTSLIKAFNGLWPHGGGEITLPEGATTFYATQDVRLPPVSLKQLVCLPAHEDEHSDTKVAALLHKAGLGEFIEFLLEPSRDGKIWEEVLSGGQKQKLVLARILLHQPGLLFLDEATSALDVEAKAVFHQALKDACPAITVISIMHEAEPPKSASGEDFYDSVLRIADGVATKRPLRAGLPAEITTILEKPVPATALRKRVPPRQHLRQKQE
ncbi:ABC transporter ATP-binding protein/permease [Pseudaminobacter sp. 19-2017]|uniref:ABC transporter ATP-binding protein/permease n=1 Tax=Pseudaminobacter soli (ex Zhang et al. 2022) TaxID=2831468 RepID=A0A942E829_9HYPH|nr:ABC transporter ATP-binding protein/permease [Pseudaminobacter soli]MBS3652155.1 ABC transporter ATP-binding protein/permease [Pseudaminobacter soli]